MTEQESVLNLNHGAFGGHRNNDVKNEEASCCFKKGTDKGIEKARIAFSRESCFLQREDAGG